VQGQELMTFATLPIQTFLPFVLLWAAVILSFIADRRFSLGALALAVVCGVATGVLQFTAVASIICLGLSIWLATNPSFPKVIRYLCYCAFLALTVALMIHMVPGFSNILVFERVRFSPDSFPFTMYLNFDKIVVGHFSLHSLFEITTANFRSQEPVALRGMRGSLDFHPDGTRISFTLRAIRL